MRLDPLRSPHSLGSASRSPKESLKLLINALPDQVGNKVLLGFPATSLPSESRVRAPLALPGTFGRIDEFLASLACQILVQERKEDYKRTISLWENHCCPTANDWVGKQLEYSLTTSCTMDLPYVRRSPHHPTQAAVIQVGKVYP